MLLRRVVFAFIGLFAALSGEAQEYRFKQYRVEQGLPSDVIKAVTEDSLGFIWIASDDGLVKYDGVRFTTYKSAFHSQYVKGFIHTRDGKLLAYGDLDFIEIQNLVDTVIFKTLLRGGRNPTDSTVWFPKDAYEDREGNIWLAEPQSLLKYNGTMKRYDLGAEFRSPVFLRSFYFLEDEQGYFYAIGYRGEVFRYDQRQDAFVRLSTRLPSGISDVHYAKKKLWLAAVDGFYNVTFSNGEVTHVQLELPIEDASHITLSPDSTWWISTYGNDLYKFQSDLKLEALLYNFQGINSTYYSREGDIWVATDKGLVLVQKNQFVLADINSQTHFVEDISYDSARDIVYYCYKEQLIAATEVSVGYWEGRSIYADKNGYFQGLQFGDRGLWASSAFEVLRFEKDILKNKWNFAREGNFVHDIFLDSNQDLWLSQSGNTSVIIIKNKSFAIDHIAVPITKQSEINLVREGSLGMYVGASGLNSYLFFMPRGSHAFRNVSLPVNFKVEGDFNIQDIAVHDSLVWLGSTEGLLLYDHHSIHRVDLGESFTNFSVSSVEILDAENILFSNTYGLFRYNIKSRDYWLYDENAGLPSNTITHHGIFIDKRKRVWAGTSFGLALAIQPIIGNLPTPAPVCVDARINGTARRFRSGLHAPYGAYINLQFASITFPENKINLQWRWSTDAYWHHMKNHEVSLTDLKSGNYQLLVRAKKNSGQDWSTPSILEIVVERPYWQKADFVFLVLFACVFIAWVSYSAASRLMQKRREFLQNLVLERTQDLQRANEELMVRNTELDRFVYSASHDLSAPLKSILGLISVARIDNPDEKHRQYLGMMERSVRKLEEFIRDVVSYSRNTRMPVRIESCSFTETIKALLLDHQYAPNFDKINFIITDSTGAPMRTDLVRIKIILNNLISNAIKFHRYNHDIDPYIKISLSRKDNQYVLVIEDNGCGIEEKHLHHIFEMFYRASEQSQGSGLGLYILKESVAKLNGTVDAISAIDRGTTFIVTLPVPPATFQAVDM